MRRVDLARPRALFPPGLDELAVLVEFDDAGIGVAAMPVADKDIAIGRDQHRRRRVELVRTAAGDALLAERHQHLAVRAELEDLVALAVLALAVGDPDIALRIDKNAVREHEHAGAEACDQLAGGIELEDRWQIRLRAIIGAAA